MSLVLGKWYLQRSASFKNPSPAWLIQAQLIQPILRNGVGGGLFWYVGTNGAAGLRAFNDVGVSEDGTVQLDIGANP